MPTINKIRKNTGLIIVVFAILMVNVASVSAAGASFSLSTSSGTIRVGDTITITGSVSAAAAIATFDLDVTYDPSLLEFQGAQAAGSVSSSELDIGVSTGRIQFLYLDDGGGTSGITGGNIFQLSFRVIGGQAGNTAGLNYNIRTVGDASAQAMTASGSGVGMSIAAPRSSNNNLKSLSATPGSISPAFSPGVTSYTMSVPFEVDRINLQAAAEDTNASVNISSPGLAAGGRTTLSVTVTAESGAQKTYSIVVTRAEDPNYVPESNSDLASLSVEGFAISPAFSPDQKEYIVYLPFEIQNINIAASAAGSKAKGIDIKGNNNLIAGQVNIVEITVIAEDDSEQVYLIAAFRAEEFTSLDDINVSLGLAEEPVNATEPEPEIKITEEIIVTETIQLEEVESDLPDSEDKKVHIGRFLFVFMIIIIVALMVALSYMSFLFYRLKQKELKDSIKDFEK